MSGTGEVIFAGTTSPNVLEARGGGAAATAATLTIGSGITVHGTQDGSVDGASSFDAVINQGTIVAETGGKTVTLQVDNLTNQGTLSAPAGTLTINSTNWSNPSGTLVVLGTGVLNLDGNFTTAAIGNINRTGGTINIVGTLDNTGATLALNAVTGSWQLLSGGTIKGGTITGAGGASLSLPTFNSGTFDGVTLATDVTMRNGAVLTLRNGLVLNNGTLILGSDGNSTRVDFSGTQSLSGTGEVIFAGTNSPNVLEARGGGTAATAATLTIGSGITVHGAQGGSVDGASSFDAVINQGTIVAETGGKTVTLVVDNLTNQGTLSAPAGTLTINSTNWSNPSGTLVVLGTGVLNLDGNFTTAGIGNINRSGGTVNILGTLDNTGATLALNAVTGSWQLLTGGTIKGGSITGAGGASLSLPAFNTGTVDGVTLATDVTMRNGAVLTVRNGLVLNNGRLILGSDGNSTRVDFSGTQSLSGTGEVIFAGTNNPNVLEARGGGAAATAATLTIGSGITVHGAQGGSVDGASSFDAVINQGTIVAETGGKTVTLLVDNLTNQGTLSAPAGTLTINSTNWSNPSGTLVVLGTGVLNLDGNFTTAAIGNINRTGGTINIVGTLDNTGATLALNAVTGSWQLLSGGTIKGGTITGAGGASLSLPTFNSGTFDGVTLATDVTMRNGAVLTAAQRTGAQQREADPGQRRQLDTGGL